MQGATVQGIVRAALIAIILVVAQLQCVAACVGGACADAAKRESMPPCHRHQNQSSDQGAAPCVQQTLSTAAMPQQVMQVAFLPHLASAAAVSGTSAGVVGDTWGNPVYLSNFSPPGTQGLPAVVLRI